MTTQSPASRGFEAATTHRLTVVREPACVPGSDRVRQICWDFGVPPRETPSPLIENVSLEVRPGLLGFITGPSGSGKSSLLRALAERIGEVAWVSTERFPRNVAIVDAIAKRAPLGRALEIMTACGLGEARLWVRSFTDLSDGERFRAALARTIGQVLTDSTPRPILCDEFTTLLHRRLARAVAFNLRKLITRTGLSFVAATACDDMLDDLQPDWHLRLGGAAPMMDAARPEARPVSLRQRAVIEPGSVRDYAAFSPMHYRHRDRLGFVDKVFVLRESAGGATLGIVVFAHAPMELAMRNLATDGRFVRQLRRLNRELRILRRLVMHPDIRGCGLGHWFVRQTLPRVGVRFVECLAVMGAVNPVFERAGFRRVGRCPLPRGRLALVERMRKLRVDPFGRDFSRRIAGHRRVRGLVERTIRDWHDATHAGVEFRIDGRDPLELARLFRQIIGEPPIYYLWDREGVYPMQRESTHWHRKEHSDRRAPRRARRTQADGPRDADERTNPNADRPLPRRSAPDRDRLHPDRAPTDPTRPARSHRPQVD